MAKIKDWFRNWRIDKSIRDIEYIIKNNGHVQLVSATNNGVSFFIMKRNSPHTKHYYLEFISDNQVILRCEGLTSNIFYLDISMITADIILDVIERAKRGLHYTDVHDIIDTLNNRLKIELIDRM